ncbi:hypothetical protein JAAARDRAFT_477931 [Jaapia argillacea MUCL 33604]|uniref:Uncharacterized protein n=1 Tax=Jaapia argillacea MUCL 33604 TaxID=933084 RepID=A0A067PFA0_9AGAM|nr:hypothetical protein JAAARDRAFT_477931 [Jaapia argillacea MUCL 33604]
MRTLRQGREGVKVSGFQTILGIPRSLEERRVLIRDGIGGLFFHKTIFRKLPYETTWIALFRGSMALISTTCVGCYALNLLVVLPITESISLPIRTTTGMPQWKAYESSLFHRGVPDSSIRPVLSDVAFIFGQMQYNLTYSPSNSRPFLPEDFIAQPAGAVSTASLIRMDGSVGQ